MVGNRTRVIAIAVATLATLASCGIKKEVHQRALGELSTCQGQLAATEARRDTLEDELQKAKDELLSLRGESHNLTEAQKEAGKRITDLNKQMAATEAELIELRKQRDLSVKRMSAYKKLNERFRSLVNTGKLKVDFRNGQMVIKLPSEILFSSGQATISGSGETELAEILSILKEFKGRRFMVAGHTDSIPVKSRKYKSNWELSTARAVSVVKFMIDAGFEPNTLAAAGYGEFDPLSDNRTKEGRSQNRRIEIILVPDLSELPKLDVNG